MSSLVCETADNDRLSFPNGSVAVVFGANGGIGSAFVNQLREYDGLDDVFGFSRSSDPAIDLLTNLCEPHR